MSEIKKRFDLSASTVKKLKTSPTNDELLKLYGLYKQATGDCNTTRPTGLLDYKEKAKWDAWNSNKGMKPTDAMTKYSDFVMKLIEKYGL